MEIRFDKKTGRFRDSSGRFVSDQSVRDAINKVGDAFKREAGRYTKGLKEGRISKTEWANKMTALVKNNLVVTAAIGRGGHKQMSKRDWGRTGAAVKREYRYLRGFSDVVNKLSPAQAVARARSYAQAGFIAFSQESQRARAVHASEAKRNLHASESCEGCRSLAGEWVLVGEMPPIGSQECGHRCRCSISYR